MRIDDFINRVLTLLFGIKDSGDRRVYFHSQNLNEDRNGDPKGFPWEGRCWLRFGNDAQFKFSWHLWKWSFGGGIGTDDEDGDLQFHFAFPPVSLWWNIPVPKFIRKTKPFRTFEFHFIEVRTFDNAVWWKLWHGGNGGPRPSRLREGNWHPLDTLFGRMKYSSENLETKDVFIPMPEGKYPAKAKMEEALRKRPRWFGKKEISVWIDIPRGIPHEGKGESDYDCGEDALMGAGSSGPSYEKAIARVVESVLTSRRKYNGSRDAVYPDPANRPPPITPPPDENMGQASA